MNTAQEVEFQPPQASPASHEANSDLAGVAADRSLYCRYTEGGTAADYRQVRKPVGIDQLLKAFESGTHGVPLARQTVLDAGCGGGAYIPPFVGRAAKFIGVDGSEGMLSQAQLRVGELDVEGKLELVLRRGDIRTLPVADASVHSIMNNMVIHHLDVEGLGEFVREAHRVLVPGGVFCINHCEPLQIMPDEQDRGGCYWYYRALPEVGDFYRGKAVAPEVRDSALRAAGFSSIEIIPLRELYNPKEIYYDRSGPASQQWRNGDSSFKRYEGEHGEQALTAAELARIAPTLPNAELRVGITWKEILPLRLAELERNPAFAERCIARADAETQHFGNSVLVIARK